MDIKYHVSPKGPRLCDARVRACKYAAAGAAHFDTQAEAQAHYETVMEESFGLLPPRNRIEREIQSFYRDIDTIRFSVKFVKDKVLNFKVNTMMGLRSAAQKARAHRHEVDRRLQAYLEEEQKRQYGEADEDAQDRTRTDMGQSTASESSFAYADLKNSSVDTESESRKNETKAQEKPIVFAFRDTSFESNPKVVYITGDQMKILQKFMVDQEKEESRRASRRAALKAVREKATVSVLQFVLLASKSVSRRAESMLDSKYWREAVA